MIFDNMDHIVFAGDSVTDMGSEGSTSNCMFDRLGNGYVREFHSLVSSVYPEIQLRVTNSGIGGNTSRNLLQRFQADVIDLKPDWVSICIGINDVWRQFDVPCIPEFSVSIDEYENNLEMMIKSVINQVKGVFILTPYYMEKNEKDEMRATMDKYCEVAKNLAKKYNCKIVDFQTAYAKYFEIRHSSSIAWDRVHPNRVGAALMAREILKQCDFDFYHQV